MAHVLEVDDNGRLVITPDLLSNPAPRTRYIAEELEGASSFDLKPESNHGWDGTSGRRGGTI